VSLSERRASEEGSPLGRAFVAVVPPDDVLDAIAAVSRAIVPALPGGARATVRDQWHLTLQFLGNRVDLDATRAALPEIALREGAVRLGGVGAFPSARRARIAWVGVAEGGAWLAQAAACVAALLAPSGFVPEDRSFHPHVTLARMRAPTDVRDAIGALDVEDVGAPWTASEIVLFESRLGRPHATYVERARVRLSSS
jgi:2'-5' RNA ligase